MNLRMLMILFFVLLLPGYDSLGYGMEAGTPPSPAEAPLAEGGHITGTVTADDGGAPLNGIEARAYVYNSTHGYWQYESSAYTDDSGYYDISYLIYDTYRVEFRDNSGNYMDEYYDNAPDVNSATDIPVIFGVSTPPVDAAMATAGHITGLVTAESDGNPLAGIQVLAFVQEPTYYSWQIAKITQTDTYGQYDLGSLPAGTYCVEFIDLSNTYIYEYYDNVWDLESAADIEVIPGVSTLPVDAALAVPGHISGTVTAESDGTPVSGIEVSVYFYDKSYYSWEVLKSTYTNEDGQYDIGGLAGRNYRVGFHDYTGTYFDEYYDNVPDLGSATDIPVTPGVPTPPVNAALVEPAHITGTVTAETGGALLPDIQVTVYIYNAEFEYWQYVNQTYTDSGGQYDIGGLAAGNYRVGFWDNSGTYLSEYYENAQDVGSATDIPVTPGVATPPVNVAMNTAGHITGTVTAEINGNPLQNISAIVIQYNPAGGYWDYLEEVYTDSSGHYDIGGLAAGSYRVVFQDPYRIYLGEYYDNAPDVEIATDIEVTPGMATPPVNAALAVAGRIGGTVTAEDGGASLSGIHVTVYGYNTTEASWQDIYSTNTDGNGLYDIGGLAGGNYRVGFREYYGMYLDEYYENAPVVESADDILVTPGVSTPPVDAALATAGHITGIVTAENSGEPLYHVAVTAYRYDPEDEKWDDVKSTHLNQDGQYDIAGLPAASYRVGFYDLTRSYQDEFYDNALSVKTGTDIPVTPGVLTPPVNAQLALCGIRNDIPLSAGWNMISIFINPHDPLLSNLLAAIEDDMVLLKNDIGQVYWPATGTNSIINWDPLKGYQIYMQNPATLSICGEFLDPGSSPLELPQGWSLVTYLPGGSPAIGQALSTIAGELFLAKDGRGRVYWPKFNVNQLGDMQEGQGYQLYLKAPATLTYPAN